MRATLLYENARREQPLGRRLVKVFRRDRQDGAPLLLEVREIVPLDEMYAPLHSPAVPQLVGHLLDALHIDVEEAELIVAAAHLHNLSRTRLPDHLAGLAGGLAADSLLHEIPPEFERHYPEFLRGLWMVQAHHERWDGRGLPHGRTGEEIPFGARVIAVGDAFVSLTTDRSYRRGLSPEDALTAMTRDRGQRWQPEVVQALCALTRT